MASTYTQVASRSAQEPGPTAAAPVNVIVQFGSVGDAARWFAASRFAGNMPARSGLANADTLDLGGPVPARALIVTSGERRAYVVEPTPAAGSGEVDRG
jgi:hypothetical protein